MLNLKVCLGKDFQNEQIGRYTIFFLTQNEHSQQRSSEHKAPSDSFREKLFIIVD